MLFMHLHWYRTDKSKLIHYMGVILYCSAPHGKDNCGPNDSLRILSFDVMLSGVGFVRFKEEYLAALIYVSQ